MNIKRLVKRIIIVLLIVAVIIAGVYANYWAFKEKFPHASFWVWVISPK